MNQPVDDPFEIQLKNLYTSPAPEDSFVTQLGARLASEAASLQVAERKRRRPRMALVFAAVCLALVSTVAVIGPEQVWAAVRGLLGYVPGIGIVPVSTNAMVLAEPVEYTHDGITLSVEQLLSNTDNTLLVYTIAGMPTAEKVHSAYLEVAPGQDFYSRDGSFESSCAGPDCPTEWTYRGTQKFYELPAGTTSLALVWKRYTPNQLQVTQEWRIPLQLKPLTEDLRARLYPPAYSPSEAVDTVHHVTLQVSEVTQDVTTTVLKSQMAWPEPFDLVDFTDSTVLVDNLGNLFERQDYSIQMSDQGQPLQTVAPAAVGGASRTGRYQTLVFQPITPSSREITLNVQDLYWQTYFYANLKLDLGINPAFGNEWPLDVTLDVAGQKLHLTGMRLIEKDWVHGEKVPLLEFHADPLPELSGVRVDMLNFDGGDNKGFGYSDGQAASTDGYIPGAVLTQDQLKSGKVTLFGQSAMGILHGPWQIHWTVPKG